MLSISRTRTAVAAPIARSLAAKSSNTAPDVRSTDPDDTATNPANDEPANDEPATALPEAAYPDAAYPDAVRIDDCPARTD